MRSNGDARPLYEQVADTLRRAITRGDLAPGDTIPSEAELRERHGVSRDTIRKALHQLTQEGLLTTGQGRTRHVRSYAPLRWALSTFEASDLDDQLDAWATDVKRQGRRPSETVEVAIVVPPEAVAERLRIDSSNELTVVRRRVRYVDDSPYQIADSYFPEPLVRGTPLMRPRSVSAPGGILASIGHPQSTYLDEIAVRMPTKNEVDRLELPSGTPVAEVTRTGYAEDETPLRVMVTVAPGDRNVLVYRLNAS
ncbi:MAG TPA: GntR family transcriptional regulator [Micromonosporaceae bacterium]|jgi:GntR family transcriptional regulator|nr:GntR family transcriptional regulator [Micromonosporaceae bacterium]